MDETRECYRRCFQTPDGQKVLSHMLIDLGYFDADQKEPALKMFGARLLSTLGFCDQPGKVAQLVGKCFEITQEDEGKK
jgi:hypothetical protein